MLLDGYHGGDYRDVVQSGRSSPTLLRNQLPPSGEQSGDDLLRT
jgi:hypothetical protein